MVVGIGILVPKECTLIFRGNITLWKAFRKFLMPSEASQEWHAHCYPNSAFCPHNALESLQKAAEAL